MTIINTNNKNKNKNRNKHKGLRYDGYEGMSAFTACPECDEAVFIQPGQRKAWCKMCGSVANARRTQSDNEIINDTIEMLELRLRN